MVEGQTFLKVYSFLIISCAAQAKVSKVFFNVHDKSVWESIATSDKLPQETMATTFITSLTKFPH